MIIQNFILYASYIAIPFLFFLIYLIINKKKELYKNKSLLIFIILFILGTSLFIYARFIERNIILVHTTKINTGFNSKLIVISDLHLGVYKNTNFLKRIVKQINEIENADAVLIPGDFTYYPPQNLATLFSPLKNIKYPVYAVLGNHDSQKPGPSIQKKLQQALEKNNVIFLHNSKAILKNKKIILLGLGDRWANQDDLSKINQFSKNDNLIVLTHNPDTTLNYKNSIPDLTITGHTHGGQIRIPWLYKKIIPCKGNFDQGLYIKKHGKVFVTAGVGEIELPMRLGIPPTIDILETY